MKQLHIYTDLHYDILIKALAEIAASYMDKTDINEVRARLIDFLSQNNHIHLDAFMRICLEDCK